MTNFQSLYSYYPEIFLAIIILVSLVQDLFLQKNQSWRVGLTVFIGLAIVAVMLFNQGGQPTTLFSKMVVLDPFSKFFKIIFIIATMLTIIASFVNRELEDYSVGEYFTLIGILTFGLFLMSSAIDLLMLYVSIEIVSIISFILVGYLKLDARSNESSLKYVLYGAFSSGIMLYGLSLLFGITGSTNYFEIQKALFSLDSSSDAVLIMSLLMIFAGFGYKISAVPFHSWAPDVYEGAPTTVTAYLSVAPKAAGFAVIIRFFHQVFSDGKGLVFLGVGSTDIPWPEIIGILAVATMTLGNLVALQQDSIKRMLAYSSIAHAGYMMLSIPVMSMVSISAIMFYLLVYIFMNLGAFFIVISVKNENGGENFSDYKGLGWRMPFLGSAMTLFMLSLTGLPPTAGFIGKFYIFSAIIEAGSDYYWLAIAGGVNSVISLYYYFRVVKVMFLDGERSEVISYPSKLIMGLVFFTAVPTLLFGIYWNPIIEWVYNSSIFYTEIM